MQIEFDDDKDAANQVKHGISLAEAARLDWVAAVIDQDPRDYPEGEIRYLALAPLGRRIHAVWYTWRGEICRVIGLRKANPREVKRYERSR